MLKLDRRLIRSCANWRRGEPGAVVGRVTPLRAVRIVWGRLQRARSAAPYLAVHGRAGVRCPRLSVLPSRHPEGWTPCSLPGDRAGVTTNRRGGAQLGEVGFPVLYLACFHLRSVFICANPTQILLPAGSEQNDRSKLCQGVFPFFIEMERWFSTVFGQ